MVWIILIIIKDFKFSALLGNDVLLNGAYLLFSLFLLFKSVISWRDVTLSIIQILTHNYLLLLLFEIILLLIFYFTNLIIYK